MATSTSNSDDTSSGSSGSDNGDSAGSNGPAGSTGSGGSDPSIDGLTSAMKTLNDDKKADLKLTADARAHSLQLISNYREVLKTQRELADWLDKWGNVGTFMSAIQTKNNLLGDVDGPAGVKDTLDKSLQYLDELEATVKKAADSLMHAG
jgi:hypothetical protein